MLAQLPGAGITSRAEWSLGLAGGLLVQDQELQAVISVEPEVDLPSPLLVPADELVELAQGVDLDFPLIPVGPCDTNTHADILIRPPLSGNFSTAAPPASVLFGRLGEGAHEIGHESPLGVAGGSGDG